MSITISHPTSILRGWVELPSSKSESNRILILQALSGGKISSGNLSEARDTQLLQAALSSASVEVNVQDAGTAMRFLTAYYCVTNQHKILTGSERMCERPIGPLVKALKDIGFKIRYLRNEGFPPIETVPTDTSKLESKVSIAGNISSQYISALMMIAPVLDKGLEINFTTELASRPYIELTGMIMQSAGIETTFDNNKVRISAQPFKETRLIAGADWSAAGYWFSIAALAEKTDIKVKGLTFNTAQGDKVIAEWCKYFGVQANQEQDVLLVSSNNSAHSENSTNSDLHFDFTDYPDLAQTVIVLCAARDIRATFSGLQSLRIKETDRIGALQNELIKFGMKVEEIDSNNFQLSGVFKMSHQVIATYNDHRMAMAFAPLAMLGDITIENPEVVEKSYPNFWREMEKAGFTITSNIPQ